MKGVRLYLIGGGLVLIAYLVAQYYKPKPTDWSPTYLKEDKIPYGTYILRQEISGILPDARVEISRVRPYNFLQGKKFKNSTYLFVAGSLNLDSLDGVALMNYMRAGNRVFVASFNLGSLSDSLKLDVNSAFKPDGKSVPVNFVNPALKAKRDYVFDRSLGNLYFSHFDTAKAVVLGLNNSQQPNFLKYSYGKGALYVLPNPQLLSNFALLNTDGADYAAKALSYIPPSATLIWDEYNTRGALNADEASPLRVIFAHDQLRWAYYLALASVVCFILFEMKRRQRIIPIIEPLKNTSVDFVKVVGRVYYQQRDNTDIAVKKINYLMEYIRTNYRLKTTALDKELEQALIHKTNMDAEIVRQLFQIMNAVSRTPKVTDEQLISLNKWIEKFYKNV
jgi:hypothetical protein